MQFLARHSRWYRSTALVSPAVHAPSAACLLLLTPCWVSLDSRARAKAEIGDSPIAARAKNGRIFKGVCTWRLSPRPSVFVPRAPQPSTPLQAHDHVHVCLTLVQRSINNSGLTRPMYRRNFG